MSTGYNVDQLFKRYFNIAPRLPVFLPAPTGDSKAAQLTRNYVFGQEPGVAGLPAFNNIGTFEPPADYYLQVEKSATGTPMWDVYKFVLPDSTVTAGGTYRMPDLTVADFNLPKNIVKTAVNGRKGTVKELISDGDWQVRFRGFIVDYENDAYPLDQVRDMRNMFKLGKSLRVVSKLCNNLGIYELVCEEFTINPTSGAANVATFELVCSSDEPIELEVQGV